MGLPDPIRFEKEGNPFFPLPPDYADLTRAGQKLARVNGVRLCHTPEDAVHAWSLFQRLYLLPDVDSGFDPGFYKPPFYPSPPMHYNLIYWLHSNPCVTLQAPRGFAKSTVKRSIILWKLLTQPGWEINSLLAKDEFCIEESYRVKLQLEQNDRILNDFGYLRPPRGAGLWTGHTMSLTNRSIYRVAPIDGRLRGLRGTLIFLDDVENDEGSHRSLDHLEELKEKILKIIVPMLDDNCKICILGTFLGKRSFLYHMISSEEDDRFLPVEKGGPWFKKNLPAIDKDGSNAWEAKYTERFLDQKMRLMGSAHFQTEYMGNPTSEDTSPLILRPTLHEYTIDPPGLPGDPFRTGPRLSFHMMDREGEYQKVTEPLPEKIGKMQRVITVDSASSLRSSADYSAVICAGLDSDNVLWVLDGWHGRVLTPKLGQIIWDMARKWRVSLIGIEAFGPYLEVARQVALMNPSRGEDDWHPMVYEMRPPTKYSKEDRIMSLQPRLESATLKLPMSRSSSNPTLQELVRQITDFTPDGKGLAHDDVIDALSLTHFLLRNAKVPEGYVPKTRTPVDMLLDGERYVEGTDIPLAGGIDISQLSPAQIYGIMEASQDEEFAPPLPPEPQVEVVHGRY